MKILFCSKLFYPSNSIGAIRPYNIAKYLKKNGNAIMVFTESDSFDYSEVVDGILIHRIRNSKTAMRIAAKVLNRSQTKSEKELDIINHLSKSRTIFKYHRINQLYLNTRRQIFALFLEVDWYFRAKRIAYKKLKHEKFDVVISSFGPYGSYLLGKYIAKSSLASQWISDLRDIMHNQSHPKWLNLLYKKDEKFMAKYADAITVVSCGQAAMFRKTNDNLQCINKKIHVLYNGYENHIKPEEKISNDGILNISYTGDLYEGKRDFRMLFEVLNELLNERTIDKKRIILNYAGRSAENFRTQLKDFPHVEEICKNWGNITREEARELQRGSNILVVLTWNSRQDQGILTGKFQEYLQYYKPIIAITTGDLPNGELTQIVIDMQLGFACEYYNYNKSYLELKEYILFQYGKIQKGEPLFFSPDIKAIKALHYEVIAGNFNNLCKELLTRNIKKR